MIQFVIALLFSLPCLLCAERPLVVGMELSYPPFETVAKNGDPCGISVDIARALGKSLNREIVIENIAFVGLVPALRSGKIDLIISSMSETEERKKSIAFSDPYIKTGLCLLVHAHSSLKSIDQADEPGCRIVVKSGTSGEVYASQHLKRATVRVLDKEAMCVLEVIQGKADAFIYDQLSVYANWKKNPTTTKALLAPFQKEEWAIGVRKNNPHLLAEVNAFISAFRKKKGFEKLGDEYLSKQKESFKELGVPFVF